MKKLLLSALVFGSLPLFAQSTAITTDPPADRANPAKMDAFTLPSHGALINVIALLASGTGPHPVVLMLHGFPGNERNLDVAQAIRRAGYTVLVSSYRGAWGSEGAFSFAHCLEDAQTAVDYLRVPANAQRLRADAGKIVLMGHSMGGWMALATGASDAKVRAVITISAADMSGNAGSRVAKDGMDGAMAKCLPGLSDGSFHALAGDTAEQGCRELIDHAAQWNFANDVKGLVTKPVFLITSDDGTGPAAEALAKDLRAAGSHDVHEAHLATDHSYSGKRIGLTQLILDDLASLRLE